MESLLQALLSGLAVGSAYALVALGFSVTFTTTKTLNFSHGEFVSAGAFIGMSVLFLAIGKPLTSTSFGGVNPGAMAQLGALLAALVVMGLIGWLLFVLGVRPFARRPGMAWVMSTLGFGVILQSIGLAIWGPKPVVVPSPVGDDVTGSVGNDYYLRIAFMMCVYYMCGLGMNVLVGYAGQKSLGQAGLFAAGAYSVALLTTKTQVDPWLALALGGVISGVCGVMIALPSLRVKGPYRRSGLAWSFGGSIWRL
jgi:branched-chain amino acid transport system permease protein